LGLSGFNDAGRTPKEILEKVNHVFEQDGCQPCDDPHQHSESDESQMFDEFAVSEL
jgi:hypothetical protein